jgi:hypothetical protein
VSTPTPEYQLQFLSNLQRLLGEGQFVATYKFALLLALADTCVEQGQDTGAPLVVSTKQISAKFIGYYWRQAKPYLGRSTLRQNTGRPAAIIRLIEDASATAATLPKAQENKTEWVGLVAEVESVVREMPLWKLQTVGNTGLDFLYPNVGKGRSIELRPGVMYCFRYFYPLITDLVRGAWVRYVRRFNAEILGNPTDLDQFLFGSERASLSVYGPILREVQEAKCFYCQREIGPSQKPHVDHFIPWATYPIDLGHNFVLAHETCNGAKADHLAAAQHLRRWTERNRCDGEHLRRQFITAGINQDLLTSSRIAAWAYSKASSVGAMTWIKSRSFEPLPPDWFSSLQ